jgi:Zn-dependent protease
VKVHFRFWILLAIWAGFAVGLAVLPLFYFSEPVVAFSAAGPLTFGFVVVGWIVGVCLHEYAHAISAYREGDYMAKIRGYLTLDPLRYISAKWSFGVPLVLLILGGIPLPGAAVNIELDALKSSRSQLKIALAGPFTTLAFSVGLFAICGLLAIGGVHTIFLRMAAGLLAYFALIAFFANMLPIPGLDGYLAIEPHLTGRWHHRIAKIMQNEFLLGITIIAIIILAIVVFSPLAYVIMTSIGFEETDFDQAIKLFRFWAG